MATNTPQPTLGERLLALGGNPRDLDSVRVRLGEPANRAWMSQVPARIGSGDAVIDVSLEPNFQWPLRSAPLVDPSALRRFFLREGARYYRDREQRPNDLFLRAAWNRQTFATPFLADPWQALPRVLLGLLGGVPPWDSLYRALRHEARKYRLGDSTNFYDLVMEPLLRDDVRP